MATKTRKIKDEQKPAILFFKDGTSVQTEERYISNASNQVYFSTKGNKSPHGETYMRFVRGGEVFFGWSVHLDLVSGVK